MDFTAEWRRTRRDNVLLLPAKNILGQVDPQALHHRLDLPNGLLHLSQIDGAPLTPQ